MMRTATSRGGTLLELIVCVTLLGLMVTFLLNLLPNSLAMLSQAQTRYQASKLARSLLEQEATTPFNQLTVGSNVSAVCAPFNTTVWVLQGPAGTAPSYLLDLRATVQWQERTGIRNVTQDLLVHNLRT